MTTPPQFPLTFPIYWDTASNPYIPFPSGTIVVGAACTSGQRGIANRYPPTDGLTAGTTKTHGRVTSLVPKKTLVSKKANLGLS